MTYSQLQHFDPPTRRRQFVRGMGELAGRGSQLDDNGMLSLSSAIIIPLMCVSDAAARVFFPLEHLVVYGLPGLPRYLNDR